MRGVDGKLVVGGADPTFIPAVPPFTGTLVSAWGVFGMPTGSSPSGGLIPRAVVQIGPPCPPITIGGITLPTANSLEVNGISYFIGITNIAGTLNVTAQSFFTATSTFNATQIKNALDLKNDKSIGNKTFVNNDNVIVNSIITCNDIRSSITTLNQTYAIAQSKKSFDIKHPSKEGHRLRHVCVETEEAGVYIRGKNNQNVIELPDYWKNFVYEESITVNLTPIGSHQNLFVEKIEDNKVFVGGDKLLNYYYTVFAERKDCGRNVSEYKGYTPDDYPGDNSEFSIVGWDYDRRR
jgi:hypothetical protein